VPPRYAGIRATKTMKIRVEFHSSPPFQILDVEVLLPPFAPNESMQAPTLRSRKKDGIAFPDMKSVEPEQQVEEFVLSHEQINAITDAVRAIRITPSPGSFAIFSTDDGWGTKLTLDACDSSVILQWFCNPPPEWIGVGPLCTVINRMHSSLQRGQD
jgi:hypothetical protein